MENWCTIESDPGVFTELIQRIGVRNVQVEELYGLSDEEFKRLAPIYGLIFLFKWQRETEERAVETDPDQELFFATQMINNACATQALLSILLNNPEIDIGEELREFRSVTLSFPPDLRGEAIASLDNLRMAHNSFSRPEPFMADEKQVAKKDDDVFHFIAYIPFKGKVYELDGLKPGPICLGQVSQSKDWLSEIRPHIEKRIESYGSEIRFNLMALIKDQRVVLEERKKQHMERLSQVIDAQSSIQEGTNGSADSMEVEPVHLNDGASFKQLIAQKDPARLTAQRAEEERQIHECEKELEMIKQKFERWKVENTRRKHNYIPFVVSVLKLLASRQRLEPMIKRANDKAAEREKAAQAAKQTKWE